jgi:hypothetical protein
MCVCVCVCVYMCVCATHICYGSHCCRCGILCCHNGNGLKFESKLEMRIQQDFTFTVWDWIPESPGYPETKVSSDGLVDAFMDLVLYINTCPPGTQVTVEWNKNLPRYVSNGESQVFKAY